MTPSCKRRICSNTLRRHIAATNLCSGEVLWRSPRSPKDFPEILHYTRRDRSLQRVVQLVAPTYRLAWFPDVRGRSRSLSLLSLSRKGPRTTSDVWESGYLSPNLYPGWRSDWSPRRVAATESALESVFRSRVLLQIRIQISQLNTLLFIVFNFSGNVEKLGACINCYRKQKCIMAPGE